MTFTTWIKQYDLCDDYMTGYEEQPVLRLASDICMDSDFPKADDITVMRSHLKLRRADPIAKDALETLWELYQHQLKKVG